MSAGTKVHFLVLILTLTLVPLAYAQPVDLITNNGYEDSGDPLGFDAISTTDGSVAHTTIDPISGSGSLKITVNSYGRVAAWLPYAYDAGPDGHTVTLSAKLRVDSSTVSGRQLTACAIAYFFNSQEPSQVCQSFPVDPGTVNNVYLSLDTEDRQLQYIFPQFSLKDSGTIEATVDSVHYYVVQPAQ